MTKQFIKQFLLHYQGKPQQAMKKEPVRRPSAPVPKARPKARPLAGPRSSSKPLYTATAKQ